MKLDKKSLRSYPKRMATEDMMEMAEGIEPGPTSPELICTAGYIRQKYSDDVSMENILEITFFKVADLKEGKTGPVMRTFHTMTDFIHQDLRTKKTKWLTAAYVNMYPDSPIGGDVIDYNWDYDRHEPKHWCRAVFRNRKEQLMAGDYFDKLNGAEDEFYPWTQIRTVQGAILDMRLDARRANELAEVDEMMDTLEPVPDEFREWVFDTGLKESQYLVFVGTGGHQARIQCTKCGCSGTVDRRKVVFKDKQKTVCPFCGAEVTARAKKTMPECFRDYHYFVYIDPRDDCFWLRIFYASRYFRQVECDYISDGNRLTLDKSQGWVTTEDYMREVRRALYTFPAKKLANYAPYEWGVYHQRGNERWCPGDGNQPCWLNILYPGNLPEAWEHTPMKYSALEILATEAMPELRYEDIIQRYLEFPKIEWIIKMGLYNLATELLRNHFNTVNTRGRTIYEILGIGKEYVRILQELDGGERMLYLLRDIEKLQMHLTAEQVKEYFEVFRGNSTFLQKEKRPVSIHKLCRYIKEESKVYKVGEKRCYWDKRSVEALRIEAMVDDWKHYLDWCQDLGYDIRDKLWFMPHNFLPVHDRVYREYLEKQDREAIAKKKKEAIMLAKRTKAIKKAMAELMKENTEADGIALRGKGLMIVVPNGRADLVAEGEALHHCVATYAEKMARGDTSIFFIRRESDPSRPYFTLEYKNGKVIQCRGDHNCGMPTNVAAFVKVFEEKMQKATPRAARKAG